MGVIMKNLFYISALACTITFPGIAFAQQHVNPISEEEYNVILEAVCDAPPSATPGDVMGSISSSLDRAVSSEQVQELQDLAIQLFTMPSIEKSRMCAGGQVSS